MRYYSTVGRMFIDLIKSKGQNRRGHHLWRIAHNHMMCSNLIICTFIYFFYYTKYDFPSNVVPQ